MKMFKKSALVLAMTASAGMAHAAGVIDIQAQVNGTVTNFSANAVGPVTLEALLGTASQEVSLDVAPATRSVIYSPNTNIGENSTITFEVANGAIKSLGDGLPALLSNSDETLANGAVVAAELVDFDTDANGNYTQLRFQVVLTGGLVSADGYVVGYAGGTSDGDDVTVVSNAGLTTGSTVSIAATSAQDPSAIAISQGTAPAENVLSVISGLSAFFAAPATSTIDVEADPSRTKFVAEAANSDTPNVTSSIATLTVENTADITFDLVNDTYSLTLARSNAAGVDAVEFTDTVNAAANFFTAGSNSFTYAPLIGAASALDLVGTTNTIDISVSGNDVLATGEWKASLSLTTDEVGEVSLLAEETSHIWDINGAQFKIPYHAQNVSGFNFFFNAINESDLDAEVFADVIVQNKSTGVSTSLENVLLGSATAESSTTFGQAAIKDAVNAEAAGTINDSDVYHVHMTLTAIAPSNTVHVAAFQKDAVGRTVVPVLRTSGWQQ